MEKRLGFCLVLISITCFSKVVGICSVPDTKKSYVTSLAINMGRSVGPCVTPDPSVLLALNLGSVKDNTAVDILKQQLKEDAVDRVSHNKTFTSGKVALYVLALRSSCVNPSNIPGQGENINLVQILENKTREELKAFENNQSSPSVVTTWYQVGLDLIGLCVMSRPYAISAAHTVANHISPSVCGNVDTAAVVAMGFACVLGMENVPQVTLTAVNNSLTNLLIYILEEQHDGLLGNAYSTGLAAQAFKAAESYYCLSSWDCPRTIDKVIELITQKAFDLPIAAAQVLPFLWGKSYVSVKYLPCPVDQVHLISVKFTVVNDLVGEHFQNYIIVEVTEGSTLLQVMEKAAIQNPSQFSFQSQNTAWGIYITAINHLEGNDSARTYWQFLSGNEPLQLGVSSYIPSNNENIIAIFSKY
ncbi:transcobalamin-1-like [Mantella aurantiaca]